MTATAFSLIGWALIAVALKYLLTGCRRTGSGWMAAGLGVFCISAVIVGDRVNASAHAGVAAVYIWWWWNSGGGDGTRRRLQKWARAFQGVRRTAPAGGTA